MKTIDQDTVEMMIDLLTEEISKKITRNEKETLEIRPSVSHGDIEVFMNGRLYWLDADHLSKVIAADLLESHVKHVLERLRGKRYIFTEKNPTYDLLMVQKEINYILLDIIEELITEDEMERLDNYIDSRLMEIFKLNALPEEHDSAQFKIINLILKDQLIKLAKKRKNG